MIFVSYIGERSRFIVVYADDIMLISPSVVEIERLLHVCENELNWLDLAINFKKSCCVSMCRPSS